jgi:hypothetical protein
MKLYFVSDQSLGSGEVVLHTLWLAKAHSPALRLKLFICS